jgi:hypothetical protein
MNCLNFILEYFPAGSLDLIDIAADSPIDIVGKLHYPISRDKPQTHRVTYPVIKEA